MKKIIYENENTIGLEIRINKGLIKIIKIKSKGEETEETKIEILLY